MDHGMRQPEPAAQNVTQLVMDVDPAGRQLEGIGVQPGAVQGAGARFQIVRLFRHAPQRS
jgi:hypothetical protein